MKNQTATLAIRLTRFEGPGPLVARRGDRTMEFHVSKTAREEFDLKTALYRSTGTLIVADFREARTLADRINKKRDAALLPEQAVKAGRIHAAALIDEILHDLARIYRETVKPEAFRKAVGAVEAELGRSTLDGLLLAFTEEFPPEEVHRGKTSAAEWLAANEDGSGPSRRELAIEELLLLRIANENPANGPLRFLFDDGSPGPDQPDRKAAGLAAAPSYARILEILETCFRGLPGMGEDGDSLLDLLRAPMRASPYSLAGQLEYIKRRWGLILGDRLLRLLGSLDLMREEDKPYFPGPGPSRAYVYAGMEREYERFSPDRDWMPNVVMMAKSALVWLHQLSLRYGREISRLDQVPNEELETLSRRGFNALWLIGIWERSAASERIKRKCGNPEAAASAYALFDYEIAGELGGWEALDRLRARALERGIRLAADMVPNHTGIDSAWIRDRPELFMSRSDCPYPGYSFTGEDLSGDPRVGVWLEDHYYDRSDAAVVFKRLDRSTGRVDYVYHGNDGTGLPWSDTAQIDFLKTEARDAVRERILHVAKAFPIIRFDAAMVLAKRHFRRLWYPEPGQGGDVPSRSEYALPAEDFNRALPEEFWREVVDTCARDAHDTLLLAEAFWMMEGYFVRTLGMHRVYNSAFMNMLKREENAKYRETIRNTQEFDKEILKRFVNFMNNPDEETAVAQFGSGDKYFGVCTLMATMPGLPMFGHGQLEGFTEKYGMEYRRAYKDELPDEGLVQRHEREIFPLLRRRHLFSGVEHFHLFDFRKDDGSVNENVFAYVNGAGGERALVVYNNSFERAAGRIKRSAAFAVKTGESEKRLESRELWEALGLRPEPGRYLAMREQRSGLWFLRSSADIAEGGLSIILDGYQSQVFLDLFEASDESGRLYGALAAALNGRGVPELSEALEDLARAELYGLLGKLFSPRLIKTLGALSLGEARDPGEDLEGLVREPARAFYAAVRELLAAESGEPLDAESGEAQSPKGAEGSGEAADPVGRATERLMGGLRLLAALEAPPAASSRNAGFRAKGGKAAAPDPGVQGLDSLPAGAEPPRTHVSAVLGELSKPGKPELAAAFLLLESLGELVGTANPGAETRALIERLGLERKLREALREAGMDGRTAHRGMSLVGQLAAVARTGRSRAEQPQDLLSGLLAAMGKDEGISASLGVNTWEGVRYFNKESYEEYLGLCVLAALILDHRKPATQAPLGTTGSTRLGKAVPDSAKAAEKELLLRVALIGPLLERLAKAEGESGYRLDDFLKFLFGE